MIISFKDGSAEDLFNGVRSKRVLRIPQDIWPAAQRKLDMLNAAHALQDLKAPPGNRLEALSGDKKGYHSIRINDQYRIVFKWAHVGAAEVQILDYH